MLALVQSSGLGSAFHASTGVLSRGRPCVAHLGNLRYQHVAFAVAQPDAVDVGEKQLTDSLASKGYYSTIRELRDTYPVAWREMIKEMSRNRLDAPVDVNHKQDQSRHAKVLRRRLLAAATSLPEAENFLKQQLGISTQQKVKISYSLAPTLDELYLVEECEVNERTLRERPMPYLVGYANGWFVSEL